MQRLARQAATTPEVTVWASVNMFTVPEFLLLELGFALSAPVGLTYTVADAA